MKPAPDSGKVTDKLAVVDGGILRGLSRTRDCSNDNTSVIGQSWWQQVIIHTEGVYI